MLTANDTASIWSSWRPVGKRATSSTKASIHGPRTRYSFPSSAKFSQASGRVSLSVSTFTPRNAWRPKPGSRRRSCTNALPWSGFLDAVFCRSFCLYTLDDVTPLFGKLDPSAETIGDVQISLLVLGAPETCGVVGGLFGGDGEVVASFPVEAGRRGVDDLAEPFTFELSAFRRCGSLLVKRCERVGTDLFMDAGEFLRGISFRAKSFAVRASQRIGGPVCADLREGGEIDYLPLLAAVLRFSQKASGEVVFVPAGLDEDDLAVGLEAGVEVVVEPVPDAVAAGFAFRLGAALYGVIDDYKVRAVAGDSRTDADRTNAAALGRFPFGLGIFTPKCKSVTVVRAAPFA